MYEVIANCVDCGKEFVKHSHMQKRCPECQEIHTEYLRQKRYEAYKASKTTQKSLVGAVYINGHPQVCTHMKSCFYGSTKEDGCSYAIEERKTRTCNGHYIVDGKCDLYRPKGRQPKRSKLSFVSVYDLPVEKTNHNYSEV